MGVDMQKILIIDATGRSSAESRTKLLSEAVLAKRNFEGKEVIYLDLYNEDLPKVDNEVLKSRKSEEYSNHGAARAFELLTQFEAADEYIFIFPTWNWSVPAILKEYIDLIMVSGRLFTYRGMKIVGLLDQKKATIINTTGGPVLPNLLATVMNNQSGVNYMQNILKIMGIKNVDKYIIDGTSYRFKNKEKNMNFDPELYQAKVDKVVSKMR